jgi:hypothetical protein
MLHHQSTTGAEITLCRPIPKTVRATKEYIGIQCPNDARLLPAFRKGISTLKIPDINMLIAGKLDPRTIFFAIQDHDRNLPTQIRQWIGHAQGSLHGSDLPNITRCQKGDLSAFHLIQAGMFFRKGMSSGYGRSSS